MAKAHTFTDNFNDNSINTSKWEAYGPVQEVNHRLEIRPDGGIANYAGCKSTAAYDLTDSFFHLEVRQALLQSAPTSETAFFARGPGTERILFSLGAGELSCGLNGTTLAHEPYDPERHRWWRMRESAGVLHWEVSANGREWNTLVSEPAPFTPTSLIVELQAGCYQPTSSPGVAIFDCFNTPPERLSRRAEERRLSAQATREQVARLAAERHHPEHFNNNDEVNYPDHPFIGSYSKGLKHDSVGDPDPISYGSLLRALESRDPGDFEEILQPSGAVKLVNPQAGLTFELSGPDPQAVTQPPAPRFDSKRAAAEMGELYWMALARDVPFINYASEAGIANSIIERAIRSLTTEFPLFGGTPTVTAQNLFRGIFPGEQVGPYISQFLWKGNSDPRKPDGQGRDADEGFITYGSQVIDQRQWTVKGFPEIGAAADYMTQFATWLAVQNGRDDRGKDQFDTTRRRFIRNLRDGAQYVHFDQVVNAYLSAAFLLLSEPLGNQLTGMGASRPQVDKEFPCDQGNPYDPPGTASDSRTQVGFATFGPIQLMQLLGEVSGRAGRAVWWQKWGVHRRLRPEEYGGRVDNHLSSRRTYPLDSSILNSLSTGLLSPYFSERWGSFLLPQAYPEGAPLHPAYGAGHATLSGACATILKAYFDESAPIENPRIASADGTALVAYTGADAAQMTVGGELNKLAGNIALFRNAAGVHWRTDYSESLLLGERVALGLLLELSLTFNEDGAFFQFTRFDGSRVRVVDGREEPA
ncbi:vanadium-dependent haloperoxidase [Archangium lansingense]|uniref:vanadium-dependent haloperoxidase n=1 Tax=Archangium lansingense TaxID=2995310 RepID=UPI003B7A773C